MKGVIQVGAHYAEEYEGWLSEGYKNFVFFEPVKANYDKIVKILPKSDNIIIYNIALGDYTGAVDMYIETEHNSKSCSILEPKLHLEQYPDIVFTHKETVSVRLLDHMRLDMNKYDYLHIDVQGYELEVLKGAVGILKYIDKIKCEVYREELYKDCPMLDDIQSFLKEHGFWINSVDWCGFTWGNALFKRYKV